MRTRTIVIGFTTMDAVVVLAIVIIPRLLNSKQVPDQTFWPTQGWRTSTPEDQGFDSSILADGWITNQAVSKDLGRYIEKVWNYLDEFEKYKHDFKIIKYLQTEQIPRSEWLSQVDAWGKLGVTHTVVIPSSGWTANNNITRHLADLQSFAKEAGL